MDSRVGGDKIGGVCYAESGRRGRKKGKARWGGGGERYFKGADGEEYGDKSRLVIMGAGEEGVGVRLGGC